MDHTLRRKRAKTVRTAFRAHQMQAHVKRFIRTLRNEVLDHVDLVRIASQYILDATGMPIVRGVDADTGAWRTFEFT